MISATAKATAGATVTTTTTNGIVLEPSVISPRRVTGSSQLVPSMLSELSFLSEIPPNTMLKSKDVTHAGDNISKENDKPLIWSWNGLLCFSMDDPDLFFDAEENLIEDDMDSDGKLLSMATSVSSADLSEHSEESTESVEAKLDKAGSVVTTVFGFRGGEQGQPNQYPPPPPPPPPQNYYQSSSPQHNGHTSVQAFDHPSTPQRPDQFDKDAAPRSINRVHAPPPPRELPLRFLRAGKGDPIEGQRRYEATLQWRQENNINSILFETHPFFDLIQNHYPHYFHLRGKKGEPVFFEQPPKTNLPALRAGGLDLPGLVRYYAMITEFQWQFIERDDLARSITVFDLEGMRIMDFAGEVIEYVKMCSTFTGQHYPERAGHVIVVNVPRWFAMIWKVVQPMVDEVTLQKISIVRGQEAVFAALSEKIPYENIPPEYGGGSMPLGHSPEEYVLRDLILYNNAVASGAPIDPAIASRFASWGPIRSY